MTTQFDQTQQELTASLKALRLIVKEVGRNYVAGLEADVARIQRAVSLARTDEVPNRQQLVELRRMLKWINNLDLKPQKGRRRDLKDLDKTVTRLSQTIENW